MKNTNFFFMQSKPYSIEYNIRIGFVSGACFANIVLFFIFYFNKNRKQSNSIISNLIMFSCLIQAGLSYTIFGYSIPKFDISKNSFFTFLYYYLLPKTGTAFQFYYTYFMMYFFIFQSLFLFFEAFYCWESIQLFKNPISSFSLRGKIYAIIGLGLIAIIIANIIIAYECQLEELEYLTVYVAVMITLFSYLIFFSAAIISCFAIVNSLLNDSMMVLREKKIFCYRHLIYCILDFMALIYPFVISITLLEDIKSKTEWKKENEYKIILYIYTALGLFINILRLFELNLCSSNSVNSIEGVLNTDFVYQQVELNKSELNPLLEHHSVQLIENIRLPVDFAITTQIKTNFLEECFCYIIQCIEHIAIKQKDDVIPMRENYYSQISNHLFTIVKGKLLGITSSEPVHVSILNKFCNSLSIFSKKVKVIEYLPYIFHNIRKIDKISKEQFKDSFDIQKNLPNLSKFTGSEGKSGSIFFFTYDNKYLLKTISDSELYSLLRQNLIKSFYELLAENNHSLLCKIYGAYTLKIGLANVNVILMENLAPFQSDEFLYKFDLKGSQVGRQTKQLLQNTNKTLKDLDFLEISKHHDYGNISLLGKDLAKIKECLKEDLNFLQNANLMDYSFFIAIMKNNIRIDKMNAKRIFYSKKKDYVYLLGIIDYLTEYNNKKIIENTLLNVANFRRRNTFSAVNPILYRTRFYNFMYETILKE